MNHKIPIEKTLCHGRPMKISKPHENFTVSKYEIKKYRAKWFTRVINQSNQLSKQSVTEVFS